MIHVNFNVPTPSETPSTTKSTTSVAPWDSSTTSSAPPIGTVVWNTVTGLCVDAYDWTYDFVDGGIEFYNSLPFKYSDKQLIFDFTTSDDVQYTIGIGEIDPITYSEAPPIYSPPDGTGYGVNVKIRF